QPMRPVDQAPGPVEALDVPVLLAQVIDEALEDAVVVQEFEPRFVVHLEADDRGMRGVPGQDLADDPLGVEPEGRVREVDLLARAPADALPGGPLTGYLRVLPRQPRRHRV